MTADKFGTWVLATSVADLPEGDAMRFQSADKCIAVYNSGGRYFATAGICSHEHAFMSEGYLDGYVIECPLHQALFDIRTGANLSPPATRPLATYETRIENGNVMVFVAD